MSERHDRGRAGEECVCRYLAGLGWHIAARNYRVRGGEIDIVAESGDVTAFVEVKTRKPGALAGGLEAVDAAKRKALVRAAGRYLEANPKDGGSVRFDVAEVTYFGGEPSSREPEIRYYENAFDAFCI